MAHDQTIAVVDAAKQRSLLSPAVKAFVGLGLSHAMVDCYGSVFPMFKTLAGLDLGRAGMIAAVATIVTTSLQPIIGLYADHGHRRRLLLLGSVLVCTTMLLGPVSLFPTFMNSWSGYAVMFAILLASQMGGSMYHPPATTLAGQTLTHRRSTVVALFISCGMAGMACSHLMFANVFLMLNQHTELLLLPAAAIVLLVWLWCRTPQKRQPGPLGVGQMLRGIASLSPRLAPLWLIQVLITATWAAMIFLMPEFVAGRGYAPFWVNGGAFFMFIAGSALMMVPAGHLADRFSRRRVLTACLVLGTPAYYLLVTSNDLPATVFFPLVLLTGGVVGAAGPISISLGQHLVSDRQSLVTGLLMGFAWAFASPAKWIAGELAKRPNLGPDGALTWMGGALIVAIVISLFVPASLKNASA